MTNIAFFDRLILDMNLMKYKFSFLASSILLLLVACHNHVPDYDQGGIALQITQLSGETYEGNRDGGVSHFLPYPLDMGTFTHGGQRYDVFVLGKGVANKTTIGVEPFKEIIYHDIDGNKQYVLIAYPTDMRLSIGMGHDQKMNGDELYAMQHIIEYWYSHKDGLTGRQKVSERPVTSQDYTPSE